MDQTTASDFLFHLNQGSYRAALDIARELQLDTDAVYKAQWHKRCADKTPATWHAEDLELLKNIRNDAWVVRTCLELVVDDWSLQQAIIELGKQRAEANNLLIQAQFYFDQYSRRLETFIDLWPSLSAAESSFAKKYQDFRDADIVAQAVEYARTENSVALRTIFSRHTDEIIPYRLAILAEIPVTADPSNFDLPQVLAGQEAEWIIRDGWADESNVTAAITSDSCPTHEYPASADTITQWYLDRCRTADQMGLCGQALEWARYAQAMGVTDLKQYQSRLDWLCKYVYTSGNISDHAGNLIDLDIFEQISSFEIMEGLLRSTDQSRIVDDMLRLVIPWLKQSKVRHKTSKKETLESHVTEDNDDEEEHPEMLLYRWLLDTSTRHLDWICIVLEHSKPTLVDEERIIKDDLDLARLALAICYTVEGDIHLLVRIFECLPVFDLWEIGDMQESEEQVTTIASLGTQQTPLGLFLALQSVKYHGLTQMMDTLQNHLSSAEVLSRYHASVPLSYFLKSPSVESQRQLCIRMASHAAGGVEEGGKQFDSDNDWRELLDDMMRLRGAENDDVFGLLTRTEVFETFFTSLLRNGRFRLAKDLMVGPGRDKTLDIGRAEQLVIEAEQEFFDNATSGNMYTGNMKLAMECLEILPPTDMVNEEMDLIRATHTLISEYHVMDRPGIELMPIQVRQSSNRLELVSKLINSRRGIYRQPDQVLDITRKLGYQYDMLAEVKVLAMLSSAALVDGDFDTSYQLCCATVAKAASIQDKRGIKMDEIHQAAWQACFNLGKMDVYQNYARRMDVLSMALTMSPVEYIGDVLDVWRQMEQLHPPTADAEISLVELEAPVESQQETGGWHSLLDSAKRHQWRLGGLLKGEADGTRKVRDLMGSWLFQG